MLDATAPFLLFDDARAEGAGRARLYQRPIDIIETRDPEKVRAMLAGVKEAQRLGLHAAGFLSYEAGYSLEERLRPLRSAPPEDGLPLIWFGLFHSFEEVVPSEVERLLPQPQGALSSPAAPLIERAAYEEGLARVKAHIEAGDIYQANLSFQAEVKALGHPLVLYAKLRPRSEAGHGGIVFTGSHWLLSFSPELFFTIEDGRVIARPMKGTAKRQADSAADAAAASELLQDPKQRAENLMIVDLLRNDLSRVSKPGTVKVPRLFEVESYPTVHQMTSTVVSELEEGLGAVDLIAATFPCGSITGAPKIRAMEIIAGIEEGPRGVYTGSIGWIEPGGDASFNVAIRTLTLTPGEHRAALGLGSGIVADSESGAEWRECLAKGAFVEGGRRFYLIETMRFDPHDGIAELERHLARMKASAAQLDFSFDRHAARNDLQAATFRLREPRRLRLVLSSNGSVVIEGRPLPEQPGGPVEIAVRPLPVSSEDFRLRHKTSDRTFYDEARNGQFEVLFEDDEGFLTEGSFTSLFVEREGKLLTPPLTRGLLPGILREKLIEEGDAEEAELTVTDLADGFYIGNIVRGLIPAKLAQ
ncbi:aminodeoxychorismate synthase component I [Allosphingosinicella sp.]|uniref:aminodeoxychorismate synthase component I n=1 Tax=Allosphingosinicella sp. TaxID=2823234 RepID=UPI0039C85544